MKKNLEVFRIYERNFLTLSFLKSDFSTSISYENVVS